MASDMQKLIIQSFVSLLAMTPTTVRYKILIVSRPESHIVSAFSMADISRHIHHLCLDEWNTITDIEVYLRAQLEVVKQTHPLKSYIDPGWPSVDSIRWFLHKSFESFAYATSAMRYISSHDRHPDTSLKNLLFLKPDCAYKAHAELDELYRHVLQSLDEQTRHTILQILCLKSWRQAPNDVQAYSSILGKEQSVIELAIIKMSSVLRLNDGFFSYYHTSFRDFLLDEKRSGPSYLYSSSVGPTVAMALMRKLWACVATLTMQSQDDAFMTANGGMLGQLHTLAVDMRIHIVNAFITTSINLPTRPASLHPLGGLLYSLHRGVSCSFILFSNRF